MGRHTQGSVISHLERIFAGIRFKLGLGQDAIDQTHMGRFFGVIDPGGHQNLGRVGDSDDMDEPFNPPLKWIGNAQTRRRNPKAGIIGTQPQVAHNGHRTALPPGRSHESW